MKLNKKKFKCNFQSFDENLKIVFCTEVPAQFTMQLEDTKIEPNEDVTFTCRVNKDVEVNWLIDSKEVPDSPKYDIKSKDVTHSLTIKDLHVDDSCEVSAVFGDTTTSAKHVVEGKLLTIYKS